jgi:sugar lactone lactonase YvrE
MNMPCLDFVARGRCSRRWPTGRVSLTAACLLLLFAASSKATWGQEASETLQYPLSVAAVDDRTLYVADRLLPGVWKFTDGAPAVFARGEKRFRTPLNAIRAVAVAADGSVFVGDSATREIYRLAEDGTPTPLTGGKIGIPVDLAITSTGQLFVSDLETQRIWQLPVAGGDPEEVAQLAAPRGLFVDTRDQLWAIAASGDAPLVRVAADGSVDPVVTERAFEFPHDVVVDDDGVAYVSDNYAACIWQVSTAGDVTKLVSGAPLQGPVGLARSSAGVLVADPRAKAIYLLDQAGTLTAITSAQRAASTDAKE